MSETITVAGKTVAIADLPTETQRLLTLYQQWEMELIQAKNEVYKIEGALRSITTEINNRVVAYVTALHRAPEVPPPPDDTSTSG